jgi:hypothetical protein
MNRFLILSRQARPRKFACVSLFSFGPVGRALPRCPPRFVKGENSEGLEVSSETRGKPTDRVSFSRHGGTIDLLGSNPMRRFVKILSIRRLFFSPLLARRVWFVLPSLPFFRVTYHICGNTGRSAASIPSPPVEYVVRAGIWGLGTGKSRFLEWRNPASSAPGPNKVAQAPIFGQ